MEEDEQLPKEVDLEEAKKLEEEKEEEKKKLIFIKPRWIDYYE